MWIQEFSFVGVWAGAVNYKKMEDAVMTIWGFIKWTQSEAISHTMTKNILIIFSLKNFKNLKNKTKHIFGNFKGGVRKKVMINFFYLEKFKILTPQNKIFKNHIFWSLRGTVAHTTLSKPKSASGKVCDINMNHYD